MVCVPKAALYSILNRWEKCKARYERIGSNQHMEMPANWPFDVEMTMGEVRTIVRAVYGEPGRTR